MTRAHRTRVCAVVQVLYLLPKTAWTSDYYCWLFYGIHSLQLFLTEESVVVRWEVRGTVLYRVAPKVRRLCTDVYHYNIRVWYKVPLRDMCDVKSWGWRKLMKRDTKVPQQYYYCYSSHSLFMLEETWLKKHQDRSSCWLPLFALNIIMLLQLFWVAGEGPTIEWSYRPRKMVREKRLSFRGHGDYILLTVCGKWSHVLQVGVGEIPFHHQVMPGDIDDIEDPRYHMSRRTFL